MKESNQDKGKLQAQTPDVKIGKNTTQIFENTRRSQDGASSKFQTQSKDGFKVFKPHNHPESPPKNVWNPKTIDIISRNVPIEILPSEIIFKDIQVNQTYEITVFVRNLTQTARRIRVYQPQTPKFRVDYEMAGAIAAGLAMKLIVTFETSVLEDYHDMMKIVSDDNFSQDIPLHAYAPQGSLIFQPFINLGFVKKDQQKTEKISFKNEGQIPAKVQLKIPQSPDISVNPTSFTIGADQELGVSVTYQPTDTGIFRGLIEVITEAQTLQKHIDINATSVQFTRFLIDENGGQVTEFDFGNFYFGQQSEIHGYLVNNTPKKFQYSVVFRLGLFYSAEEISSLQTPADVGKEQVEQIMSAEPAEGLIDSYSQIPITFKCQARVNDEQRIATHSYAISNQDSLQRETEYKYSAIFNFEGDSQDPTIIHLLGKGTIPTIQLNQTILQFGECSVGDNRDILFEIENKNPNLPIDIAFSHVPYYSFNPDVQELKTLMKSNFIGTFLPRSIGKHAANIDLLLVGGTYRITMKALGVACQQNEKEKTKQQVLALPKSIRQKSNNRDVSGFGEERKGDEYEENDQQIRGPEALPKNFEIQKKFVNQESMYRPQIEKKSVYETVNLSDLRKHSNLGVSFGNNQSLDLKQKELTAQLPEYIVKRLDQGLQSIDQAKKVYFNKHIANEHLKKERTDRYKREKESQIKKKMSYMSDQLRELGLSAQHADHSDDQDTKNAKPPIDQEFQVGLVDTRLDSPHLPLPPNQDTLFVTKPIDRYEPIKISETKEFKPSAEGPAKKKFESQPSSHKEIRDISTALTGEQLCQISAGPTEIDFGNVYIKSKMTKYFTVRNDLRTCISVRIITDREEFAESYFKQQIIPSSGVAMFDISLRSKNLGPVRTNLKYIINEKHVFEFQVSYNIELVQLELSRQGAQFIFPDDNNEMTMAENIQITNGGNATGHFKWLYAPTRIFVVEPEEGDVPAGQSVDVQVIYRPSQVGGPAGIVTAVQGVPAQTSVREQQQQQQQGGGSSLPRNEEEKIVMKITDGLDVIFKANGTTQEAKTVVKSVNLDFKEMAVSQEERKYFTIKNNSRFGAVYSIQDNQALAGCEIIPKKGRIAPDESKDIEVRVCLKEVQLINNYITMFFRGGKIFKIPITVKTIIPDVFIVEDQFDFGNITTLGHSPPIQMSITNNSLIAAEIELDLRNEQENPESPDGIDCLEVTPVQDLDESVMHSVIDEQEAAQRQAEQQEKDKGGASKQPEDDNDFDGVDDSEESDFEQVVHTQQQKYYIRIDPGKTISYSLKFSPQDVRPYQFLMPIKLLNYGSLPSLERFVTCRGLKPKFLAEPQNIQFQKKVITTKDQVFPAAMEITLSNPDIEDVQWRVDQSVLVTDKIFSFDRYEGILPGGQTMTLKAFFNPYSVGVYDKKIPLYIVDDPDINPNIPYLQISLKGEGACPGLLFDRREIILPPVPLNVESRCVFRIINDQYDNLNIQHKIIQDIAQIPVELRYIEGKNLGITKNRIKVEAYFSSKKPLSFTTKIQFTDDSERGFQISISGTADNSLFTNFSYVQRCLGQFTIQGGEEKQAIRIVENDNAEDDVNSVDGMSEVQGSSRKQGGAASVVSNKTFSSHASSQSARSALGYTPINNQIIESNIDYIMRFLNYNVLSSNIIAFPTSIIERNGEQIFELITFLTGKNQFVGKVTGDLSNLKRVEQMKLVLTQYQELIKILKIEGALLNHIRPAHLLSYADYNAYLKAIPKEETVNLHASALKTTVTKFNYISIEAWTTLFYQILKIYYLSRVTPQLYKSLAGIPPEHNSLPEYLEQSNLISPQETILLHWLETHYEIIKLHQQRRLKNFDQEFQDGIILSTVLQSYVGKSLMKYLQMMRPSCSNMSDYTVNAEKLILALKQIGLINHMTLKDLTNPSMREMMLYVLQLFFALPHYIPKPTPVVFSCILGEQVVKTIDLTNPTKKPISYWVKLDEFGVQDFTIESEQSFTIEPGQTYNCRVKFASRISDPVTQRLTFTNKRESNVSAAALVFELKSQIIGRLPRKTIKLPSAVLYDAPFEFKIKVSNDFQNADYGDFAITLVQERVKKIEADKKGKQKLAGANSPGKNKTITKPSEGSAPSLDKNSFAIADENQEFVNTFFCRIGDQIKLKKNQEVDIPMYFIPLVLETHRCTIIFKDPTVGEFQYLIEVPVDLPPLSNEIFRFPQTGGFIHVDEPHGEDITLTFQNENMLRARKFVEAQVMEANRNKYKMGGDKSALKADQLNFPGGNPDTMNFEVETSSPNSAVTIPSSITLVNLFRMSKRSEKEKEKEKGNEITSQKTPQGAVGAGDEKKKNSIHNNTQVNAKSETQVSKVFNDANVNQFPIQFLFKSTQSFQFIITFTNSSKTDIRRLRFEVTSAPKPVNATLEFRIPARNTITQEIPIINNTDQEWPVQVSLILDPTKNGNLFSTLPQYNQEFLVKQQMTSYFPISFQPQWLCQAEGRLVLKNTFTQDVFDYSLKGYGEEPRAEDHIIINCRARQNTDTIIEIKNPYQERECHLNVETDLWQVVSGEKSFTIKPGQIFQYKITASPILSGQYTGSITFQEVNSNYYVWYTVCLNTESPKPEKVIDISTSIRQAALFNLEIRNPLNKVATFDVIMTGQGLIGENSLAIPPQSSGLYQIIYSPLYVGKARGSVAFISHDDLGEIWYELNLVSEEAQAVRLPVLKCELGKSMSHKVVLENPSDQAVVVSTRVSNPTNFDVSPDQIVIQPFDSFAVNLNYMPSNLEVTETGEIHFSTQEIGKWQFLIFGMGIPPTQFDPRVVSVGLNKDFSSTIHFKNPFQEAITVQVFMDALDDNAEVFKLLTKFKKGENQSIMTVPGMNVIQIPFSFVPREINCYNCDIVISMNEKIQWRYPIQGVTESVSNSVLQHLKLKCREQNEYDIKVVLPGGTEDQFDFQITNIPPEYQNLISKCLKIKPIKNFITDVHDALEYQVTFEAFKPFKATVDFDIIRLTGGKWKYRLILEATQPDEDDLIVISSPLHQTTSVSFQLTNRVKSSAPFTAGFTPDSDAEFTVMPQSGMLEPYSRDGTNFIISFTPVQYGQTRRGQLIIQTDEMFWAYSLKGVLPKYYPPVGQASVIDD